MQLSQAYRRFFPGFVRVVGAMLARSHAVEFGDVTEGEAVAVVTTDGLAYSVTLRDYGALDEFRFLCSCRPVASNPKCQHVWATLLELESLLQSLDEAVAGYDVTTDAPVTRAPNSRAKAPPSASRRPPSWRERLDSLVMPPSATAPAPLPVIEYYVTPMAPEADMAIVIDVRERSPKKNGELSVPRASRLQMSLVDRLPRVDRDLLALRRRDLRVGSDDYWDYYRRDADALGASWHVPMTSMPLVLPLLAATGRAYLAPVPSVGETARAMRIDVEPPFVFELQVSPESGATTATAEVTGAFRRGDETLPLMGPLQDTDYLFGGDRMVRVECRGGATLVSELMQRGPLLLPRDEVPALLSALSATPGAAHFLAPVIEQIPVSPPVGVVKLTFAKGVDAPLRATMAYEYDDVLVDESDERPLLQADDTLRRRDLAAECALRELALRHGLEPGFGGELSLPRERLAAALVTLLGAGFRVLAEGKKVRPLHRGSSGVRSGIDWFEVDGQFEFAGHTAQLPELLRRKVTIDGFVELDDGTLGMLPASWLRHVEGLRMLGGEVDGDLVKLRSSQALLLDALLSSRESEDIVVDRKFAALRKRVAAFTEVAALDEPKSFQGELRPYQRHGLGWLGFLREFGLGGCLADDMGLGKTVQVLAHLVGLGRRRGRERRPSLLVAPRSVLGNWLAEVQRFAPTLKVVDFSAPDRWRDDLVHELQRCDVALTTYALVRADALAFEEREMRFEYVILDEAQAIKNADSLSSKAVRLLRAQHRLVLTGTPVENHMGDLWSLFEFLNPGMLGRLPAFRAMFGKDASAESMTQSRELVQRALRPVLLRRTKAQVLKDLPEKVEQTLWCVMEPEQRRRYDALKKHYRERLLAGNEELGENERFVVLEALLRLRQVACHEGLVVKSRNTAPSAKFEELLPRLEELTAEGHKCLVFSQFTSLLDLAEPELRRRDIRFARLDGKTRKRAEPIERFQTDPACAVFLISLKAGGFGLNLTAASYVFLLDPWWNPATEMQAIDRAHRIGQQRTVHAYRLVCRDTVEERVLELQTKKKALSEAILGNERSLLQDLTRADLELLLG